MNFIIISAKEKFKKEYINSELLNKPTAPSLIARESLKFKISDFIVYIYPYNHIDNEVYNYSYYKDDEKFILCNGLVNFKNKLRKEKINELFEYIEEFKEEELYGDYQLISIDKEGNGYIKTPFISKRQLFFYEDEYCAVISTEIKLIIDGLQKFRESLFVNNYDLKFIEESVFKEWSNREFPRNTIFKSIKRVLPQDVKYFKKSKIIIEKREYVEVPKWFKKDFNNDKNKLYDDYYNFLIKFAEMNLIKLKPNIEKITLGLTGGFDSRLTAAILFKICNKNDIKLEFHTTGQNTHPDVILAKKVAEILDVEFFHSVPSNNKSPNTKNYKDYAATFYMSQGDFNSKDFVKRYNRKIINNNTIAQLGNDAYKRGSLNEIISANRWSARRIHFHKNFFFPIFFTDYEIWFALSYTAQKNKDGFKEFVYEIINRSEPRLLDIPFAGDYLPQTGLDPYLTRKDSKHHEKEPFLWDFELVNKNLKPVLSKNFNKLGVKARILLKLIGFNELDYFLNKEIGKYIDFYHKKRLELKTVLNI